MLYRVFAASTDRRPDPFAVPRHFQGGGRHDNPDHYTALYLAREPISAVAERIQGFRGQRLTEGVFARPDGRVDALAEIDDAGWPELVDLDDPDVLATRQIRPSRVATADRSITQGLALGLFLAGAPGLCWWSTLEASWTNVTVFEERLAPALRRVVRVEPLTVAHPLVRDAADHLLIDVPRPRLRRVGPHRA
ncbi:MAG TPA: RES domain-containing protein [Candidatus Baltobacteraceae bacterium]|nr:RES domain-containing protein [Candidatus Baltobacteraceae bacterium]